VVTCFLNEIKKNFKKLLLTLVITAALLGLREPVTFLNQENPLLNGVTGTPIVKYLFIKLKTKKKNLKLNQKKLTPNK
jgi:hypothetical protein